MSGKKTVCLSLILLLIVNITLVTIPSVHAQLPIVSLNPMEIIVSAPGQNFTVDVNVTDVTNLKGFAFMLDYNTSILDATIVSKTTISNDAVVWLPVDASMVFHWDAPPTINDTIGRVWVSAFGFTTFTGSGPMLTINFTATAAGNSTLDLYNTQLLDPLSDPIVHTTLDGEVTVIPPPLPVVSLNPSKYTAPAPGKSFTIDINIADVINLQYYEFKLWFNNTLLNATGVTPGPVNPPGTTFIPGSLQNVSDGFVRAGASLPAEQAFTGNGILMTISFTALTAGNSTLHLNETLLIDPMSVEVDHATLDGFVTVLPKIGDYHTHHINDATDDFPNDYRPMVIPCDGKNVTVAPVITCTTFEDCVWKPNHHPCKLAQTLLVDDDWSDKDANYTYMFEDWTDYDWNDIVVSLYAVTDNLIINAETCLKSREAAWKNPFGVEITPINMTVEIHWNSTDYPEDHTIRANSDQTVDIELFTESNSGDTAFIVIIPLVPPSASFVYSPLYPQVCEDVTFNASASIPNGGYIVSYEWDFGDASPHEFGMVVTHHYTIAGTYNVTLNVTDSEGIWNTESKMITVTPRTYMLTVTSTSGGTTNPVPGKYLYEEGTVVSVTAIPESDYVLDHWELDGVNVGPGACTFCAPTCEFSVTMNKNHTLHAVFKEALGPTPPVGGRAIPIDKRHFLAPKIDLIPRTGLAFVLLAAMAVTIILIRRRNKILRRGR